MRQLATPFEIEFAMIYLRNGGNATKAMCELRPELTFAGCEQMGSEVLNRDTVQSFLSNQAMMRTHDVFRVHHLSMAEKRSFLASVVKTSASNISDDSPLIEEVSTHTNEEGIKTKKVKMMSKAKAIELDNKMAGHNAPELSITGDANDLAGILLRVTGQTLEADTVETSESVKRNLWDE